MLLDHETYRWLVYDRMNQYLREAAVDRRTRIAAMTGGRVESGSSRTTGTGLLGALLRLLGPLVRERGDACGETGRGAS